MPLIDPPKPPPRVSWLPCQAGSLCHLSMLLRGDSSTYGIVSRFSMAQVEVRKLLFLLIKNAIGKSQVLVHRGISAKIRDDFLR